MYFSECICTWLVTMYKNSCCPMQHINMYVISLSVCMYMYVYNVLSLQLQFQLQKAQKKNKQHCGAFSTDKFQCNCCVFVFVNGGPGQYNFDFKSLSSLYICIYDIMHMYFSFYFLCECGSVCVP